MSTELRGSARAVVGGEDRAAGTGQPAVREPRSVGAMIRPPGASASPRSPPTARCSTRGSPRPRSAQRRPGRTRTGPGRAGAARWGPTRAATCRSSSSTVEIDLDAPPASTPDAYLRLHLLSHLLVAPNTINLDGIFGHLPIVAWTNAGPMHPDACAAPAPALQRDGIHVHGLDKFPRLLDYVTPEPGAHRRRLARAPRRPPLPRHDGHARGLRQLQRRHARRLDGRGPHLAGRRRRRRLATSAAAPRSWAPCRAAARERVSIGERALLGANAGIGISIGDDSVVEAGLYVTAGTKVDRRSCPGEEPRIVKAVELSGVPGLLFRRNSQSGAVEVLPRIGRGRRAQRGAARLAAEAARLSTRPARSPRAGRSRPRSAASSCGHARPGTRPCAPPPRDAASELGDDRCADLVPCGVAGVLDDAQQVLVVGRRARRGGRPGCRRPAPGAPAVRRRRSR